MLARVCSRGILALLVVASVGAAAWAQRPPKNPITVKSFVSIEAVAPGETFQLAVRLSMKPGWHVQSNQPSDENFIATELRLKLPEGLEVGALSYPPGEDLDAPALGGTISVYHDGAVMGAEIRVAPDAPVGEVEVAGILRYQACNDRMCLFPKNQDVAFSLRVDPQAASSVALHPDVFAALAHEAEGQARAGAETAATTSVTGQIQSRGFALWLLGVFVLGLGLNLTPCVYPVIAVTISFFGRQGGSTAGRGLRSAAYSGGILAMFTALFLLAGLTGGLFGSWLQNQWVLAALALLLVALALSNFGLYELQAPAWIRNRAAGGRTGIVGAFLMGLTMGIVAAPCVGPLIAGLLIWVGQQGDVVQAGVVGLALSAGLALPYFVLGIFADSIGSMPKSGDWMDWVKHLMGFVLLGVALYFLSPILPDSWFIPAFIVLVAVSTLYLALFDRAGRSSHAMWFIRGVVLTSAVGAAIFLIQLDRAEGIEWQPYSRDALTQAAAEGRPAMVEFTADWCVPCRVMEYQAFKNSDVVEESQRFVRLRVDLTHQEDPLAQEAVERFGVAGPPTIVFLGTDGREIADLRVLEQVGAGELLSRMQKVRGEMLAARGEVASR